MEPAELTEMAHLNLQIGKNIFILFFFNVQDKLEKRWHVHVTSETSA